MEARRQQAVLKIRFCTVEFLFDDENLRLEQNFHHPFRPGFFDGFDAF